MKSPSLGSSSPSTEIFRVREMSMRTSESPAFSVSSPTSTAAALSPFLIVAEMSDVLKDLAAASSPNASSRFVFPCAFAPQIHTESAPSPMSANPTFLKFWSLANLIFTKTKTRIASYLIANL